MDPLRCTTWLAPGLPLGLFELAADAAADALGRRAALTSVTATSGPTAEEPDPFANGACDLGFLCLPSYRRLRAVDPSPIRLVPAAPVPADDRCGGQPVYFAELLVGPSWRRGSARALSDLGGARIGCNDGESLSGNVALTERLALLNPHVEVKRVFTGSHHASLDALGWGALDAAVVDSNTRLLAGVPPGCTVIEAWGPYPIQPIVLAASRFDDGDASAVAAALMAIDGATLLGTGFIRFAERDAVEPG